MADTVVIAEQGDAGTGYRFSWGLAFAGGVAASAVIFFLLTLGSGFGLMLVRTGSTSLPVFFTGGAIYFLAVQAFGFAVGGHLAGGLLGPMPESHKQEMHRACAHGFVAWAVTVMATVTMLALAGLVAGGAGATTAALYGASTQKSEPAATAYLVDRLFRPGNGTTAARAEAGRIMEAGLMRGDTLAEDDQTRLMTLTAQQARINDADANSRVNAMQKEVRARVHKNAEIARKTASYASLWVAFSLLFGAVLSVVAAVAARKEDDRAALGV